MWAEAVAAGVPDELFWRLSARELDALMERLGRRQREAYLRAGLIAATIANVHRRKGSRLIQPTDFIRERPRPEDYMDTKTAMQWVKRWAGAHNADHAQRSSAPKPETGAPA